MFSAAIFRLANVLNDVLVLMVKTVKVVDGLNASLSGEIVPIASNVTLGSCVNAIIRFELKVGAICAYQRWHVAKMNIFFSKKLQQIAIRLHVVSDKWCNL